MHGHSRLDSADFAGRVRVHPPRPLVVPQRQQFIGDIRPKPAAPKVVLQKPVTIPAATVSSPPVRTPMPPAVVARPKKPAKKPRFWLSKERLLIGLASALFIGAGAVGVSWFMTNHQIEVRAAQLTDSHSADQSNGDLPSEGKAPSTSEYHVAADLPRLLSIPKFGVTARVLRLGVTADNQLGVPGNIFDTGWYEDSAKPGQSGATLIDGHVSGPTQKGVFYNLKSLAPGDLIKIERGNGTTLSYKVVTSKTYDADKVDMVAALSPITPGKPGLNLITCTGQLDGSQTHFLSRIVVFASQV